MKQIKKSKLYPVNPPRWSHDPNKTVVYEFTWRNKNVTAGTTLRLKNDRTDYRFICLVHDSRLGTSWMELLGENGHKSARLENISKVYTTVKRSRAKKNVD